MFPPKDTIIDICVWPNSSDKINIDCYNEYFIFNFKRLCYIYCQVYTIYIVNEFAFHFPLIAQVFEVTGAMICL